MEFSIQRIFLFSFLSFIAGAGAASLLNGDALFYLFLFNACLLLFVLAFFDKRLFFAAIFLAVFSVGFIRADFYYSNQSPKSQTVKLEFIDNYRQKIDTAINKQFFPPESEFIKGLILGQDSISNREFKEDLNKTGTRHIVAVSGFNMAILAALLYAVLYFAGISRKLAFLILLSFLTIYTIFVQAPPSAVRAMIMVLFTIGGSLLFSSARPLNSLLVTAAIMILHNPEILIRDIGFQFSFLAVLGIIFFNNTIELFFKKLKIPELVRQLLSLSISAQILLIPFMIYYFKGFSIISPLVNTLAVPLSSLLLIFGLFFAIFSLSLPVIATIISFPINIIASLITSIISFFSKIPVGYVVFDSQYSIMFAISYYIIIIALIAFFKKLKFNNID